MPAEPPELNLLVQRILNQQGMTVSKFSNEALESLASPLPGSPSSVDWDWVERSSHPDTLKGAFVCAAETVATLLVAMEEYRRGIVALLNDGQMLALPIMNCVRAIHDATVRICALVDPTLSSQERLARSAADFLAKVQGGIPVLHVLDGLLGDKGDLERVTGAREGAVELFRSIGLQVQVKASTGQAQNVRCEGKAANVDIKSTDFSLKYTPKIHYAWGLNSGATHSNVWLTSGLDGPWSQILVSMVFPVLDLSDALAKNLLGYVGLPTDGILKATHTRRIMLMQHTGVPGPYADHTTYHQGQ